MLIECAEISDLETIYAIYQRCITILDAEGIRQWDELYPSPAIMQEDIEAGELFKYVIDGRIAAACALTGKQDKEYDAVKWRYPESKALVVKRLAVEPDLRKRGIATGFMKFAEDYAAKNGYTSIRLECYSSNQAALDFYRNRDCHEVGEIRYPRRELPFICFEKKLY